MRRWSTARQPFWRPSSTSWLQDSGRAAAQRTCLTEAHRSIERMRPPTAASWRLAPSKNLSICCSSRGSELDLESLPSRMDPANWSQLASEFSSAFARRTQQEWCEVFDGTDACVTPVLAVADAAAHPHNRARDLYGSREGDLVPHMAPRIGGHDARCREDAAVSDILMAHRTLCRDGTTAGVRRIELLGVTRGTLSRRRWSARTAAMPGDVEER